MINVTKEIEQVKQQMKVLEAKLSFLEELENTKSPVEESYKDWWGKYPGTEPWCNYDETRWVGFKAGYEAAQSKDVEIQEDTEISPSMFNCRIEGEPPNGYAAWNLWYKNEGSKGILHNLRIAPIEYKAIDKLLHNDTDSSEYIKLPTLYEIVADWWDEIFLHNNEAGETIESLIDTIAEDWFFKEDKDGDRYACGWNDCLEKLKLRLK
jgi:hypothetical protein